MFFAERFQMEVLLKFFGQGPNGIQWHNSYFVERTRQWPRTGRAWDGWVDDMCHYFPKGYMDEWMRCATTSQRVFAITAHWTTCPNGQPFLSHWARMCMTHLGTHGFKCGADFDAYFRRNGSFRKKRIWHVWLRWKRRLPTRSIQAPPGLNNVKDNPGGACMDRVGKRRFHLSQTCQILFFRKLPFLRKSASKSSPHLKPCVPKWVIHMRAYRQSILMTEVQAVKTSMLAVCLFFISCGQNHGSMFSFSWVWSLQLLDWSLLSVALNIGVKGSLFHPFAFFAVHHCRGLYRAFNWILLVKNMQLSLRSGAMCVSMEASRMVAVVPLMNKMTSRWQTIVILVPFMNVTCRPANWTYCPSSSCFRQRLNMRGAGGLRRSSRNRRLNPYSFDYLGSQRCCSECASHQKTLGNLALRNPTSRLERF